MIDGQVERKNNIGKSRKIAEGEDTLYNREGKREGKGRRKRAGGIEMGLWERKSFGTSGR